MKVEKIGLSNESECQREQWVQKAEVLLGSGQGHIALINYLRTQGMSHDDAKKISYDIFDEAKRRLMRSQKGIIALGYFLIFIGIFTPLALLILQARLVVIAAAPVLAGLFVLSKVVRPSRLPE